MPRAAQRLRSGEKKLCGVCGVYPVGVPRNAPHRLFHASDPRSPRSSLGAWGASENPTIQGASGERSGAPGSGHEAAVSEPRPLASVPTLADLQANPGLLEQLPTELLVDVRRQLRHLDSDVDAILARRLLRHDGQPAPAAPERVLKVEEAARLAGVTKNWLYRHADQLPFTHRISKKCLRFSAAGLQRWLDSRRP